MHRSVGFLVLFPAGLLLCTAPASAITFGVPDGDGHPSVGSIMADVPPGVFGEEAVLRQQCSGTLIHPQVFLTAGHCTFFMMRFFDVVDFFVSFSSDNAFDRSTFLEVAAVITHPGFTPIPASGSAPVRDVGVVILKEPVVDLVPVPLPPAGFLDGLKAALQLRTGPDGTKFIAVGYGTALQWPPPEIVPSDGIRRVAEEEYLALNSSWLTCSQNSATGDEGTGIGDSGGPLFFKSDDGTEILTSITSRGDPTLVATAVNYRIDTQDSLNFLSSVIDSFQD